ncbi:SoxR reducing system RseC family protein [Desulfarculus baarsii]
MKNDTASQMTEQGYVRAVRGGMAMVETIQTEACSQCSSRGACQMMGGERMRVVPAINEAGAKEGQRVIIAARRSTVMGAGFLVYMVPVMALIGGAVVGKAYGPDYGFEPQSAAVLLGVGLLAACWLAISRFSKRMAGNKNLAVRVIRIVKDTQDGGADAVDQCSAGV